MSETALRKWEGKRSARPACGAVAQCSLRDGDFVAPVETPYECEVLLDHIELFARQQGKLHVEIRRQQFTVLPSNEHHVACSVCGRLAGRRVRYVLRQRPLCRPCVLRGLASS